MKDLTRPTMNDLSKIYDDFPSSVFAICATP